MRAKLIFTFPRLYHSARLHTICFYVYNNYSKKIPKILKKSFHYKQTFHFYTLFLNIYNFQSLRNLHQIVIKYLYEKTAY